VYPRIDAGGAGRGRTAAAESPPALRVGAWVGRRSTGRPVGIAVAAEPGPSAVGIVVALASGGGLVGEVVGALVGAEVGGAVAGS
jgi:hypothetical protein